MQDKPLVKSKTVWANSGAIVGLIVYLLLHFSDKLGLGLDQSAAESAAQAILVLAGALFGGGQIALRDAIRK